MMAVTGSRAFASFAASVRGREHERARKNNQDAAIAHATDEVAIAVVCDGCSSGAASEVGARFGAAWLARWLPVHATSGEPTGTWVLAATSALLADLGATADRLCPTPESRAETIAEYFLFTFLAAVITRDRAVVFGAGDGLFADGDRVTTIDPGEANAPRYLAYALLDPAHGALATVHLDAPADSVDTLVVATDGAIALEPLGAITRDLRRSTNPSALQKRLAVIAETERRLYDDTSLALLVRKELR